MCCVGCGVPLLMVDHNSVIAISCWSCGASAPVLITEDLKEFALPASFKQLPLVPKASPGDGSPHIEYYLGYSDHQNDAKDRVREVLEAAGLVSQRECSTDPGCPSAFQKGVERWKANSEISREHRVESTPEP